MRVVISILGCAIVSLNALAQETQPDIHIGTQPVELITAKITVTNLRKSYEFYRKVVGLKDLEPIPGITQSVDSTEDFVEICLNFSGSRANPYICLLKQKDAKVDRQQAKLVCVSFMTPDTQTAVDRAKAAGFKQEGELVQFRGIVTGWVVDPDGYTVQFLQAPRFTR
jgi:catechol 2,3-dioxygenase-like lactoylglutathione lyase family enzyme